MKKKIKKIKEIYLSTYLTSLILILMIIFGAVTLFNYQRFIRERDKVEAHEEKAVSLKEGVLIDEFDVVFKELLYMSDIFCRNEVLDDECVQKIGTNWSYFLDRTLYYDHIRFIDYKG